MVAAVASWDDSLTDQAGTLGVIYSHCRAGGETRRAGLRPETPGPACAVLSAAETGILFPGDRNRGALRPRLLTMGLPARASGS